MTGTAPAERKLYLISMTKRLLIGALCLSVVLAAAGCPHRGRLKNNEDEKPAQQPFKMEPKLSARGIEWTLSDRQGRPLWEVSATNGSGTAEHGLAELRDVRCRIYSQGKAAMDAEAPRVQADYPHKALLLLGGVRARTADGRRAFRAAQIALRVREEKRAVIEASGGVRLEMDGVTLTGERLLTNPKLSEAQLLGK